MAVVGIAVKRLDAQDERMSYRRDEADLAAELVFFVNLALADALGFRSVDRIKFLRIVSLLSENAFRPVQQILKEGCECRLFQKFSLKITDHPAQIRFELL